MTSGALTYRRTYRREIAASIRLAVPIVMVHLGMMLMGTVDVMMLGRVSKLDLAAGGVGNALGFGLLIFPMGLLGALDPLASQAFGARDSPRLGRFFKQGLVLALAMSVPISLIMWNARGLLEFFGQPPEVVEGASAYLRALIPGNVAFLLYTACQRTLQSMSIVRPAFIAILFANVVNLITDYTLILGNWGMPALGVTGAGFATSLSRWVMLLCLALAARKKLLRYFRERVKDLAQVRAYRTFIVTGAPIGAHISLEYWVFGCVTMLMGYLGAVEVASHQVAINLASLAYMVVLGISEAAATRVGNAIGRHDMPGARRAAQVTISLGAFVMLFSAALFFFVPRFLSRLYTPELEVIALASSLLPIAALFEVFDGIQTVSSGVLRGAADTRVPATLALVGYWIFGLPLGLLLTFRFGLGPQGLWWGLTLGLATVAVLLSVRVVRRFRGEIAAVD